MKRQPESRSDKPSLESLLRLKREELPDSSFWADFEVRMRQRQLAAIIEPKPWWLSPALALRRFSKPGLLVTSGAAAAFGLVLLRDTFPITGQNTVMASANSSHEVAPTFPPLNEAGTIRPGDDFRSPAGLIAADQSSRSPANTTSPESSAPRLAARDAMPAATTSKPELPAFKSIGDGLVTVLAANQAKDENNRQVNPQLEPAYGTVLAATNFVSSAQIDNRTEAGNGSGAWGQLFTALDGKDFADFPAFLHSEIRDLGFILNEVNFGSANPVPSAVQPGSRFERLLSADSGKLDTTSGELASVRDRVLHRLAREEELYASVSRVGVGGDRLSLRF